MRLSLSINVGPRGTMAHNGLLAMNDNDLETSCSAESSSLPESSPTRWDIRLWSESLGSAVLWIGIAILGIAALNSVDSLPFRLPDVWYRGGDLWWLIGGVGVVTGIKILQAHPRLHGWRPTQSGRRFHSLILYTREGCHLCDEAKEILEAYARYLPPISEVDIDKDAILIAKFTTCVPVVEFDGKIRFKRRIDEMLLRRLIEGSQPKW